MSSKSQPYWMIGVPTYDGRVDMATAQAVRGAVSDRVPVRSIYSRGSLLPSAFNELVCGAINDDACEWFAMLHADVEPEAGWLSKLVDIGTSGRWDVLSVVMPMRDDTGLTSTAIDMPLDDWTPDPTRATTGRQRRLTIRESRALSPTYTARHVCIAFGIGHTYRYVEDPVDKVRERALLINTGLMLLRMSPIRREARAGRWQGFQLNSALQVGDDGQVRHSIEPEDWRFSRWACRAGLRVAATHEIKANHHGADAVRPNHVDWGEWQTDEDYALAERAGTTVEVAATSR